MATAPSITDLADEEFCFLTTTGRNSGLPREIEIWFGVIGSKLYILSGNGDRANWVRNIISNPGVTVRIAGHQFSGAGRRVETSDEEDAAAREIMVAKYQLIYEGDLTDWGRTSLPIVVDIQE